jgi:hypothetical protein
MTNARPDTSKLAVLVNPDRLRSSVKRLFRNRIDEVLSELFQNSQRSNSTTVDILTTDTAFTIQDNGHGLLNGIDGFHTLLKLAESNFANETINDQDPMGLGIVSLLIHDQVSQVTFSSNNLELTIKTDQWWNDPNYYSSWYERIVSLEEPVKGLRITVTCSAELIKALHKALEPKDQLYSFSDEVYKSSSPAQGYSGILNITLNSAPVQTELPVWTSLTDRLMSTTYKGSKLKVGYASYGRSTILWYGQLIILRALADCFVFHLEVKCGRPVNPLSPSRAGIIQDAAYNELISFIKAEILNFVFNPANRSKIKPAHVEGCYKLDAAYSLANCPYFVAESIQAIDNPNSFEQFKGTDEFDVPPILNIFTYDQAPLLLEDQVVVQLPSGTSDAEHGLQSFLRNTGPAYKLSSGDETRLAIGKLWWRPRGEPQHHWFYAPGEYGISYEADTPPETWASITTSPVFVFNDTNSFDAAEVDFVVGTNCSPFEFLRTDAWAAFSPHDDESYDPQQESYQESLDYLIRDIIGNCVPKDFTLYQISRFLKDPAAPIIEIKYHFKSNGKFVNPRRAYKPNQRRILNPAEITVKTATGERIRLKLY